MCVDAMDRPMVSIGMTVYNQEKYVAKAIESILRQKVNFTYEIVIAEDCSTDNSREIVKEYAERYPDVIRLILQEQNVGLKQQSICLKKACRGIYRAQLEGDDFWLTTDRLQKQVDFLEANEDYVAVSGKILCVDPVGKRCAFPYGKLTSIYCFEGEYTVNHFQQWLLPSHTGALLYRNVFYGCDTERFERYESYDVMGDRKTALMLLGKGRIYVMPELVSVRRIDLNSANNFTSNSVKMKPYGTICSWMDRLETMARELYGVEIDFKYEKRKQWIWALKNFGRFPTKANLASVMAVYKLSKEKNHYLYLATEGLLEKIKKKCRKEGLLRAVKNMCVFAFKALKRIVKSPKPIVNDEKKRIIEGK